MLHHRHSLLCLWLNHLRDITLLYPHTFALKNIEHYIWTFKVLLQQSVTVQKTSLVAWHTYIFILVEGNSTYQCPDMQMSYALT